MERFRVEAEPSARTLELRLFGEFDLTAFEEVDQLLAEAQSNGRPDIRIDLRGLTFIDSSGLRAILRAHKRAGKTTGRVSVVPGPRNVQRVFGVAGLGDVLEFEEAD